MCRRLGVAFILGAAGFLSGCSEQAAKPEIGERTGEYVYTTYCFACHDSGAANAPALNDQQAWRQLADKGEQALLKVSIQGRGAMPRRGSCFDCTDEEVRRALDYMLENAVEQEAESAGN